MKKFLLLLLLILVSSCSTNYYFVNLDEDANIYSSKEAKEIIAVIPKGYSAYIEKSTKKYRKVKWQNYKGWAIEPVYSRTSISSINNNSSNSNYTTTTYKKTSTSSSSGGSVHVKGYTRKNGTYVSPHTRSSPKRR